MTGGERATALLLLQKFGQFAPRQDKKFVFPHTSYNSIYNSAVTFSNSFMMCRLKLDKL